MKLLGLSKEEIKKIIKNGDIRISVFGLGSVGLPLAAVFAKFGAKVIGVDLDKKKVEMINKGINYIDEELELDSLIRENIINGRLIATDNIEKAVKESDIIIIAVPVIANNDGKIDLDNLIELSITIGKNLKKGHIVITETTLPPGTTENLIPIFEKESGLKLGDFGVAHAPERIMRGSAIKDITERYPKIIGASDPLTLEVVTALYETINTKGVIKVSSIKAAEAVKVFEGIYRDVNIALANELALWAEEAGLDVMEIINAANTQPYCHLHKPGAGVGGHCIPVYPWFIINTSKQRKPELITYARKINDFMPYHIIELVKMGLSKAGKLISDSNILILGLAFRGGVKIFFNSPAIPVIKELKSLGANVFVHDPLYNKEEIETFGVKWKDNFKDIDCIVIITDHEEYKKLDLEKVSNEVKTKVIIDGRNILNPICAKDKGFIYLGVGRTYLI